MRTDMQQVRSAFDKIAQRKMLPALLEEFLGEWEAVTAT